jgi:hypothetical protein
MGQQGDTSGRGPQPGDERQTNVAPSNSHSKHSIQEPGRQVADSARSEAGDEAGRIPRRKPGPVQEEGES